MMDKEKESSKSTTSKCESAEATLNTPTASPIPVPISASSSSSSPFGIFTSKKMSETFLRTLECPVCLEIVIPPVFSCTLGHIICSLCRPKLNKCGLCGSTFTTIRNYPIETMLSLVETECRHHSCSVTLMADKLKDHLAVCEYRPIPCHEATITAECKGIMVNYEDYPRHLMDVHGKSYVDLTTEYPEFVVYDVSSTFHGSQLLGVMNYKGKTFFLRRDYVFPRQYAMCWVTVMAPEQDARKYTFHLKIMDPKDHRKTMEWRIRAHSIQFPAENVKTSGDCAFISYDALTPFCERKFIPSQNGHLYEYKWSMVGKISEFEPPPPAQNPVSAGTPISTNLGTSSNGNGGQTNPLNLCASSANSGGSGTLPSSSMLSSSSTNSYNHSFNYTPTPMANSLSFSTSGSTGSASANSTYRINSHLRTPAHQAGFSFTFPSVDGPFPSTAMPSFHRY